MIELYHSVNSVCAQKVRVVLAEKNLEYQEHLMTLRGDQFDAEYMKLNPNAVVPTLVHDGRPVIESSVILYYLDDAFANPRLMPKDPYLRMSFDIDLFARTARRQIPAGCENALKLVGFVARMVNQPGVQMDAQDCGKRICRDREDVVVIANGECAVVVRELQFVTLQDRAVLIAQRRNQHFLGQLVLHLRPACRRHQS